MSSYRETVHARVLVGEHADGLVGEHFLVVLDGRSHCLVVGHYFFRSFHGDVSGSCAIHDTIHTAERAEHTWDKDAGAKPSAE